MTQITLTYKIYLPLYSLILTMDHSLKPPLHIWLNSIFKPNLCLLTIKIHLILLLISGFMQLKEQSNISYFKWQNQFQLDRKIEKDQVYSFSLKILSKVISEIAIFYQQLQELYKNIQNQSIDYLFYKKILRICMEFDYSFKEFGGQLSWMLVFLLINMEDFVQLNLIMVKFGLCFQKRLGLKFMDLMITFIQDITNRVLMQFLGLLQLTFQLRKMNLFVVLKQKSREAQQLHVQLQLM